MLFVISGTLTTNRMTVVSTYMVGFARGQGFKTAEIPKASELPDQLVEVVGQVVACNSSYTSQVTVWPTWCILIGQELLSCTSCPTRVSVCNNRNYFKLTLWLDKRYNSVTVVQSECFVQPTTML